MMQLEPVVARLDEVVRENERLRSTLARVVEVRDRWSDELGLDRCPGCLVGTTGPYGGCDHEEGFHYALSDLNEALVTAPVESEMTFAGAWTDSYDRSRQ